jgi:hypothetical protein
MKRFLVIRDGAIKEISGVRCTHSAYYGALAKIKI